MNKEIVCAFAAMLECQDLWIMYKYDNRENEHDSIIFIYLGTLLQNYENANEWAKSYKFDMESKEIGGSYTIICNLDVCTDINDDLRQHIIIEDIQRLTK